jgi:hypothetical protein
MVIARPHTLVLRRLQASQAALTTNFFGTRVEVGAFGVAVIEVEV